MNRCCTFWTSPSTTSGGREQNALEDLLRTRNNRVVLFGCGNLGQQSARALRTIGITPPGLQRQQPRPRWGTEVDGLEVLPPPKAGETLRDERDLSGYDLECPPLVPRHTSPVGKATERTKVAPYVPGALALFRRTFLPFLLNDLPHKLYEERDLVLAAGDIWADQASSNGVRGECEDALLSEI